MCQIKETRWTTFIINHFSSFKSSKNILIFYSMNILGEKGKSEEFTRNELWSRKVKELRRIHDGRFSEKVKYIEILRSFYMIYVVILGMPALSWKYIKWMKNWTNSSKKSHYSQLNSLQKQVCNLNLFSWLMLNANCFKDHHFHSQSRLEKIVKKRVMRWSRSSTAEMRPMGLEVRCSVSRVQNFLVWSPPCPPWCSRSRGSRMERGMPPSSRLSRSPWLT